MFGRNEKSEIKNYESRKNISKFFEQKQNN